MSIVAGMDTVRLGRLDRHFARYVDDGRLAGWQVLVSRHGELVHSAVNGVRDLASGTPFTEDTIVRLYSMTKPITSVAASELVRTRTGSPLATSAASVLAPAAPGMK